MSVGTFQQPNFETQGGTTYKTAIDNAIKALARLAAAFAPHEQDTPDMTVRVDAGALPYLVDGALVEQAAQDTAAITAPVTHPRIDLVVIDGETGAVAVVTGSEAADPDPPAIPDGKLPVCEVLLATDTTAIDNSLITDKRLGGGSSTPFASDAEAEAGTVTDKAVAPSQLIYGGRRKLIDSAALSGDSTMTLTGIEADKEYELVVNVKQNTGAAAHRLTFNGSGTYQSRSWDVTSSGGAALLQAAASFIAVSSTSVDFVANSYVVCRLRIRTFAGDALKVYVTGQTMGIAADGNPLQLIIAGDFLGDTAISEVTYLTDANNMTGTMELWELVA